MPLDFSRITKGSGGGHLEPRDIFAALPRRPWPRLRPEQVEVLRDWFTRRNERDLVIKQNTGGGKTVVGLLIAQSSLNEGLGPAVYLVPDTYLVDQVITEAERLGVAVSRQPEDVRFRAGEAVLVATFAKLVNGRTVFGVAGGRRAPINVGTVVVDDAHAALATVRGQFTATLPAGHPGYERLLKLFAGELRGQNAKAYADLADGEPCTPLRVPFWAWSNNSDKVLEVLRKYGEDDELPGLFFPWPLVSEHLELAVATFTEIALEIRPPCPPLELIPAFAQARRRVYLTATLADDGVLVTELGAETDGVSRPITPERASDLGDRIILAPLELNPGMAVDAVRMLAANYASGDRDGDGVAEAEPINVVVLVPSDRVARSWSSVADRVLHVSDMKPVVDRLKAGQHVGLIVLVNKYDGVDLPGTACRLLVIDGIPTPLDAAERREAAALIGSATHRARKVQRIEQGMGRGIRDAEDYCAVLLLGSELTLTLAGAGGRTLLSPATRAQYELSRQVATQISTLAGIREALDLFLSRDEDWLKASSEATAGVTYDPDGHVMPIASARRAAFTRACEGDFDAAVQQMRTGIDQTPDAIEKGWYLEELAAYQHHVSPTQAQNTLAAARRLNAITLRPRLRERIPPTRGHAGQGRASAQYLQESHNSPTAMRLALTAICDDITWEADATHEAEEAFRLLGLSLGFESNRPDSLYGTGPDNLWALTATHHAVIELKTGVTRGDPFISKAEVDQLAGSLNWDQANNPHVTIRTPVLVHPSLQLHPLATAPVNLRIVTPLDLDRLKASIAGFAAELAGQTAWSEAELVTRALVAHHLTADRLWAAHSSKPVKARPPRT